MHSIKFWNYQSIKNIAVFVLQPKITMSKPVLYRMETERVKWTFQIPTEIYLQPFTNEMYITTANEHFQGLRFR